MDEYVLEQKKFDRTLEWNEAGWDGSGVTIWDVEPLNDHGIKTKQRLLDAAPKAKVLNYRLNMMCSDKVEVEYVQLENNTRISSDQFVNDNHITILSHSHGGYNNNTKSIIDLYANLKEKYNVSLFNSAGNNGKDGVMGGAIPESLAIYVGAAYPARKNFNNIRIANYSSLGDEYQEVDFCHFTGPEGWNGTSFSCPYLAGISALIQQRYGFDTTQAELYSYFKLISTPINCWHTSIEDPAYDYWSGWGIPILPKVNKKYVVMEIGKKSLKIDGKWSEMDTAPFIEKQRTFVPIAFAALALDATVKWEESARRVTITKGKDVLDMYIGSRMYLLNGKSYTMDVAPFIKDQRTFVPIAFAALALDSKVTWVPEDRKVLILEN